MSSHHTGRATGLAAGSTLGAYEIVGPIGAGSMGEVYRARDTKLHREVAIKVLPEHLAAIPGARVRFEREARAIAALSHSNILQIYDFGVDRNISYAVMELLEGQTLRARLQAAGHSSSRGGSESHQTDRRLSTASDLPRSTTRQMSPRKAVEYALQIARGLSAAHEKGVVHRDLKPENLLITKSGEVKILDFGLAKLTDDFAGSTDALATRPGVGEIATEPGIVMGTVGYMAPEQVRGAEVDHRADIFALGVIIYEMLTAQRPFQGGSGVETMNAILHDDAPELTPHLIQTWPALDQIIRRCLEKEPAERFQSVRDVAFVLESVVLRSTPATRVTTLTGKRVRLWLALIGAAIAVVAAVVATRSVIVTSLQSATAPPMFQRVAFRKGTVKSARLAPDGQTIVFAAAWDGQPLNVFSTISGSTESRGLGLGEADILAVSPLGDIALSFDSRPIGPFEAAATLARASLAGGASRQLLTGISVADWSRDGSQLAIVRRVGERDRLEYPAGTVLYETTGWISDVRLRPQGDQIAFLDHPFQDAMIAEVAVVDTQKRKTTLSSNWWRARGLAWAPTGHEVWFTATRTGYARAMHAVDLSGRERLIARVAGTLTLHDVGADGRALVALENVRREIRGLAPGATAERDLSWLDYSAPRDLTTDGKRLLFQETGEGGGEHSSTYLRGMDGSPPVRLGDGLALALSPNGDWALVRDQRAPNFTLMPTGPGDLQLLTTGRVAVYGFAGWFLNQTEVLFIGQEPGAGRRYYALTTSGGSPRPVTPEGTFATRWEKPVSPDGRFIVVPDAQDRLAIQMVAGGPARLIPGTAKGDRVVGWEKDGVEIFVNQITKLPARVDRLNVETGQRRMWRELVPLDPVGVESIDVITVAQGGVAYAYSYLRALSDLYVVHGLK